MGPGRRARRRSAEVSHLHPAGQSADNGGERHGRALGAIRGCAGGEDLHGGGDEPLQHRYEQRDRACTTSRSARVITVTNGIPVIVERSMYWDSTGSLFSGGTNATGIRLGVTGGGCVNLLADPGFGVGRVGLRGPGLEQRRHAEQRRRAARRRAQPVRVAINGYGNNVWWRHGFFKRRGQALRRERAPAVGRGERLRICGSARWRTTPTVRPGGDLQHAAVPGAAGDKGVVSAAVDLDPAKMLESVNIRLYQEGSAWCDAHAGWHHGLPRRDLRPRMAVETAAEMGGGGGDGGGGGGGTASGCQAPTGPSAYPGFTVPSADRQAVHLRGRLRARESGLRDLRAVQERSGRRGRRQSAIRVFGRALDHHGYKMTGQSQYILDAINRVEQAGPGRGGGPSPAAAHRRFSGDSHTWTWAGISSSCRWRMTTGIRC